MADTVADWKDRVAYWRDRAERSERERDEYLRCWKEAERENDEFEAQLAAVPALVEALRHVVNDSPGTPDSVKRYLGKALAAWEQAQK